MKKLLYLFLMICTLCLWTGCSLPDDLQLDVYQGAKTELKLLHINANNQQKRERIEGFSQAISNAEPIDKDFSLFAFYPDYTIELTTFDGSGSSLTVVLDINGPYIDFYYPLKDDTIYRSQMTAKEFSALIHQK